MKKYIWQSPTWPHFTWDIEEILSALSHARKAQGYILAQAQFLGLQEQANILVEEVFMTSAIEGELLNKTSIRSSVARRLGLPTADLPDIERSSDGVVAVLIDATTNFDSPLETPRLFGWQAGLFPTGFSGINKIQVGGWRTSLTPMRVISGPMGKEKIHYEAPPSKKIPSEMKKFLSWWNSLPEDLDGLVRAGIAHFWFITIHPFEDGNGRIARAITDMALAQDELDPRRLYSLSTQIVKEKSKYYEILERTQKGDGDITLFLKWFLEMFTRSISNSKEVIEKAVFIGEFYRSHAETSLNDRQRKVIKKLLEHLPDDFSHGLTNQKYVSMTKTSPETAKRDIKDLVEKEILVQNEAGGRSTSYRLKRP